MVNGKDTVENDRPLTKLGTASTTKSNASCNMDFSLKPEY